MSVWYIVQCNPQAERKAAAEIRRAGHRVYMPKVSTIQVHRKTREKTIRRRPLMPGYLFVRFLDGRYRNLALEDIIGVRRMVFGTAGEVATLPHSVVAGLIRAERQMQHEGKDVRSYRMGRRRGRPATLSRAIVEAMFTIGQKAWVLNGPWADRELEVVSVTDAGMVRAKVRILDRETAVELEPMVDIVPLERSPQAA